MSEFRITGMCKDTSQTVNTTASKVPSTALKSRNSMIIYNNGAVTIYLGDESVTSDTGFPLEAGDSLPLAISEDGILYAVTETADAEMRILEAV